MVRLELSGPIIFLYSRTQNFHLQSQNMCVLYLFPDVVIFFARLSLLSIPWSPYQFHRLFSPPYFCTIDNHTTNLNQGRNNYVRLGELLKGTVCMYVRLGWRDWLPVTQISLQRLVLCDSSSQYTVHAYLCFSIFFVYFVHSSNWPKLCDSFHVSKLCKDTYNFIFFLIWLTGIVWMNQQSSVPFPDITICPLYWKKQ